MKLTKHAHACVEVEHEGGRLLIDPGAFTSNAADLIARNAAVLVTHEHFDHLRVDAMSDALASRGDLHLWAPDAVADQWVENFPEQVHPVHPGDRFSVSGMNISVHGGVHAEVHRDIPRIANVGYLIGGVLYHPGDAYHVPEKQVSALLLPTSGPWTKLSEAVDFVRAVNPVVLIQIHEVLLSEVGQAAITRLISPQALSPIPLTVLAVGEDLELPTE